MNKVFLIGRLGQNCEAREAGGQPLVSFSIATSETFKGKDGSKKEVTEWHNCTLWGTRATALAPFLVKGKLISVEGSVHYREAEKDGVKTRYTDIRVDNVELLGGGDKPAKDPERVLEQAPAQPKATQQFHNPGQPADLFPNTYTNDLPF